MPPSITNGPEVECGVFTRHRGSGPSNIRYADRSSLRTLAAPGANEYQPYNGDENLVEPMYLCPLSISIRHVLVRNSIEPLLSLCKGGAIVMNARDMEAVAGVHGGVPRPGSCEGSTGDLNDH